MIIEFSTGELILGLLFANTLILSVGSTVAALIVSHQKLIRIRLEEIKSSLQKIQSPPGV